MKPTIPGILITSLIVASPTAFAQGGMNFSGTSSNPATSVSKDETTSMTKQSKKRMTSHRRRPPNHKRLVLAAHQHPSN